VTGTAAEHERSGTALWLEQRRLKIAIGLAFFEGILVALSADFTRWTVIIISAPIIAFYFLAGRTLESKTGRDASWVAAAAQALAVCLCIIWLVVGSIALIAAGILAAIVLVLLLGERGASKKTGQG
jgi:hypothetical protein